MIDALGWLQLGLIIVAAGAVTGALISAVTTGVWKKQLRKIVPQTRFKLLVGLSLLPALAGAGALLIAFAPSMLDGLGLVQDHCAHHSHHAFHLCFIHDSPPAVSPLALGGGLVLGLWLFAGWSRAMGDWRESMGHGNNLRKVSTYDVDAAAWMLESSHPLAMTLGMLRPRVFVSERLREHLPERQFETVLAHERAHARRFDALLKFVARLGCELHLPQVRDALLVELDIACEQACDEAAATAVGDQLTVAEAILSVERLAGEEPVPVGALGFANDVLEARVHGLLDADWATVHWSTVVAGMAGLAATIVVSYDSLHHAAESLLSLLF